MGKPTVYKVVWRKADDVNKRTDFMYSFLIPSRDWEYRSYNTHKTAVANAQSAMKKDYLIGDENQLKELLNEDVNVAEIISIKKASTVDWRVIAGFGAVLGFLAWSAKKKDKRRK